MKKFIYISIITIFCYSIKSSGQITVISNGNVGIGGNITNPDCKLVMEGAFKLQGWRNLFIDYTGSYGQPVIYPSVSTALQLGKSYRKIGDLYVYHVMADIIDCGDFHVSSDSLLKENIRKIQSPLEKIKKLNGINYDFKTSALNDYPERDIDILVKSLKNRYGFLAQEFQRILPELVDTMESTKRLGINYIDLIPILVEAVKELSLKIDSLEKIITVNNSTENISDEDQFFTLTYLSKFNVRSTLEQNSPNPFNQSTIINFNISDEIHSAVLYLYDMNGLQIKSYPIYSKGRSNITINANELNPGMYLYTLITDGKEVSTKRMILTK